MQSLDRLYELEARPSRHLQVHDSKLRRIRAHVVDGFVVDAGGADLVTARAQGTRPAGCETAGRRQRRGSKALALVPGQSCGGIVLRGGWVLDVDSVAPEIGSAVPDAQWCMQVNRPLPSIIVLMSSRIADNIPAIPSWCRLSSTPAPARSTAAAIAC